MAGSREWPTVYHPTAVDEDTESSSSDDEN